MTNEDLQAIESRSRPCGPARNGFQVYGEETEAGVHALLAEVRRLMQERDRWQAEHAAASATIVSLHALLDPLGLPPSGIVEKVSRILDQARDQGEIERLQGLVKQAEWAAGYDEGPGEGMCPWCGADREPSRGRAGKHGKACPAFGEGK